MGNHRHLRNLRRPALWASVAALSCTGCISGILQSSSNPNLFSQLAGPGPSPSPSGVCSQIVSPYARWQNGPSRDPSYFPIAVWLQDPSNAARYKAIGINLYIGLWQGPTETQLAQLKAAGMPVITDQTSVGLAHLNDPTIVGWSQMDEPDNAQPDGSGGYGPPIAPSDVIARYQQIKAADPTRPVFLNLGQGVSWDGWYGRGVRTNHPEDYSEYEKGGDIVSFDIYPVASTDAAVQNNLWMVPQGVDRLRQWSQSGQPVWNWIETAQMSTNPPPTPAQIRAEVWMSLIHGAQAVMYFAHQFSPGFDETGLLDNPDSKSAVAAINAQVTSLAPVLNSATLSGAAAVSSSNSAVPVDLMAKSKGGALYVFAAAMRDGSTNASFSVPGLSSVSSASAEVVGESRQIAVNHGAFQDAFASYGVHLYRITPYAAGCP